MARVFSGLVLILIGSTVIIFWKSFSELIVGFQIWAFRMPFGEREVKISGTIAILSGFGFVTIGVLVLLGILHWR